MRAFGKRKVWVNRLLLSFQSVHRQRMKRKSELPVKSEDVSSRMYIVTRAASSSSSPMQVDPSDLYKAFMDTIARQTHLDSTAVHRPFDRHKSQRLACQTIDIT